jgi:DNA-binding IscR family transcriptional regulator
MIVYIKKEKTDIIQRVLNANKKSPSAVVLFLVIAIRTGGHGMCWPSLSKMAEDSALSLNTVKKSLKLLAAQGFITRIPGKNHGYKSTITRINL